MRGRQVCWSDPKLQALARKFIPVCDEVWRLHNLKEVDCLFFQGFCEEGHYGGPRAHGTTRQGIYCCTPSGRFLGSINTTNPQRMRRMLEAALERWAAMPKSERYLDEDPKKRRDEIRRRERQYPEDGLALRVYTRDGKRKDLPDDWRRTAWNVDSLWYRKAEARQLLPQRWKKGATQAWPEALVQRLVRHNLVDNVRGQTNGYGAGHVQEAELVTEIVKVQRDLITVTLRGRSRATTSGRWPKDGSFAEASGGEAHARGMQTRLAGRATFDRKTGRFTSFELAAVGTRWGQTRYNFRQDDLDEAPIAFAIVLDEDDEGRRVAPAEMGSYGW